MSNVGSEVDSHVETSSSQSTDSQPAVMEESQEPIIEGCTAFEYFPRLPAELRQMIIKFAIKRPRVLDIKNVKFCSYRASKPSLPVPAVLHINREFRTEALKSYELPNPKGPHGRIGAPKTYYNSTADVVYFDQQAIWCHLFEMSAFPQTRVQDQLDKITTIAVDHHKWSPLSNKRLRRDFLSFFPALEALIIIIDRPSPSYHLWDLSPSWEDLEFRSDVEQTTDQKKLVEMFKSDWRLELTSQVPRVFQMLQAQKDRVGGDGPAVLLMVRED